MRKYNQIHTLGAPHYKARTILLIKDSSIMQSTRNSSKKME